MKHNFSLAIGLAASMAATPAAAKTLFTPLVYPTITSSALCQASNVGTSDAEITVTAFSANGQTVSPSIVNCPTPPATLAAGQTCYVSFGVALEVRCSFASKAKLRASIQVNEGGQIRLLVPATAK